MNILLLLSSIACVTTEFTISEKKEITQKIVSSTPSFSELQIESKIEGYYNLYLKFPSQVMPQLLALYKLKIPFFFIKTQNTIKIPCKGPIVFVLPIYKVVTGVFLQLANIDKGVALFCPIAIQKIEKNEKDTNTKKFAVFIGNETIDTVLLPDFSFPFKAYNICGIVLFFVLNFFLTDICN